MTDNPKDQYPRAKHTKDSMAKRAARSLGKDAASEAKKAGKAAGTFGKMAGKGFYKAGKAGAKIGAAAGAAAAAGAVKVGKAAAEDIKGIGTEPFKKAGRGVYNAASRMVDYRPERYEFNETTGKLAKKMGGFKLTKLGLGVVMGIGLLGGLSKGVDAHMNNRMGTPASQKVETATPDFNPIDYKSTPVDNLGATGDLVFALHNNR